MEMAISCEQIRFLHRPLRDDGVYRETSRLLIIRHGVLDVADHNLRLFTLHKVANDGAREKWIFTHIRQRELRTLPCSCRILRRTLERPQFRESRLFL
jgi:hypothetical protein